MDDLLQNLVTIPAGNFMMGADYNQIDRTLREEDQQNALGLGAVLDSTPAVLVNLPEYKIMPSMVTNGQYFTFWDAPHPETDGLLVDDIEIWEYVWQLYGVSTVRVPVGKDRKIETELYDDCETAIDALVRSYAYECQRTLLEHHIQLSLYGYDDTSKSIVRIFSAVRKGLAELIWLEQPRFGAGEIEAFDDGATDAAQILQDIKNIQHRLAEFIPSQVAHQVPLSVFLDRLATHIKTNEDLNFKVSELFKPLTAREQTKHATGRRRLFGNQRVSWEEVPVRGVSLYEAAAFAAWLRIETGEAFSLPSEAEYEKAFSWDMCSETDSSHARNHVYPWQQQSKSDFHSFFSRQGISDLEAKATAYKQLINDTSRETPHGKLFQGVGFGWQWTRERYSELEVKYNRFERRTSGMIQLPVDGVGQQGHPYKDCVDRDCRFFCVRGAPDQLGGPGTVTRRFALSPLRGYLECGFRCVVAEAGEL